MAKTCFEREVFTTSSTLGPRNIVRTYNMLGYATIEDAETAMLSNADCPATHPTKGLPRQGWNVRESTENPNDFYGTVDYGTTEAKGIGTESVIGGSVTTQSIKQNFVQTNGGSLIAEYSPFSSGPDFTTYGAIGIKWHDDVWVFEGRNREFPSVTFTIEQNYDKATMSAIARAIALNDYVGRANSVAWRGFGIQTVKLLAADISDFNQIQDRVLYTFQASPSITNIQIPTLWGENGFITIPTKLGFQEVEVISKPKRITGPTGKKHMIDSPYLAALTEGPLANMNDILP